jgi:polar amino acid transport system substrate-binding protein
MVWGAALPAQQARPSAAAGPAELRLVTADLPPFAIDDGAGQRRGALVELSEAVLARAGLPVRAEFFPWARSQLITTFASRVLIVPLARTTEREERFQWLIKLHTLHQVFLTRVTDPAVRHIEQARRLRIGVLRGTPDMRQLQDQGFETEQLTTGSSPEDVLRLLERSHVDAIFGSDVMYGAKAQSRPGQSLRAGLKLASLDIWLAASGGIEAEERRRLEEAHAALLKDGSIERIMQRYGLRTAAEDAR